MLFRDIIGQKDLKLELIEMVNTERVPHAQLFLGPPGSGKLALAIAFAQYLLCEGDKKEDACGECASCSKVQKLILADLHFSFPFIGAKNTSNNFLSEWRLALKDNPYMDVNQWLQLIGAENKQGNINKEECLNIIRKLSLKSFESKYKVLIMWLPEYLAKEGNRLLKLIEEPPENTFFILVAENQELILNTILSRCQIVKINQLSDEDVVEGIMKQESLSIEQAKSIAYMASGNFNEALQLVDKKENDNAKLFLDWMRICYKGNGAEMVPWVENFAGIGRENQKHFLRYALHFLREYMLVKLTGDQNLRLQDQELKTAINLTKVIELHQIQEISTLFDDCYYHVERNANPKVLFLDASIELNRILKTKTGSQVVKEA
ncbi:MAG: DNA polymerase-3 subunit delta' [Saprospiraceae bacterium]|jgi:DNA polymerase-3 subunit delta'